MARKAIMVLFNTIWMKEAIYINLNAVQIRCINAGGDRDLFLANLHYRFTKVFFVFPTSDNRRIQFFSLDNTGN